MNIIQQLGGSSEALEVLKQAQMHVLAPSVYIANLKLFGCVYDEYDALFVYAGNECFAYMPMSEALANNQVIWIEELKQALTQVGDAA